MARGATRPYQPFSAKPGTPDSATVGTSGKNAERFSVVTAIALSFPLRTCGDTDGALPSAMCTCPPSRSMIPGPMPR